MADIAEDVKVDDPLMDILTEDEQSPPKESSPAEEKPAPVEDTEEAETPEVPTADTEEPEESEDAVEDERPQGKAEARKAQLNTEIRDLIAQRNAIKEEVEKANSEVYQPDSYEDLVAQGMTELEAKVESMRQENEMIKYNTQVAEAQLTINSEADRVLRDFPIFNPDDKDHYDAELADQAAELLQANLIYDPNSNQIIGSNVSPYKLYQTIARASESSAVKGQLKAQEATEKMLANADTSSSVGPTAKEAPDPILDVWSDDD